MGGAVPSELHYAFATSQRHIINEKYHMAGSNLSSRGDSNRLVKEGTPTARPVGALIFILARNAAIGWLVSGLRGRPFPARLTYLRRGCSYDFITVMAGDGGGWRDSKTQLTVKDSEQ